MTADLTSITEALRVLADGNQGALAFQTLLSVAETARLHPVRLSGEMDALNPLLDIFLEDEAKFTRLIALVNTARAREGYSPLVAPGADPDRFDRTAYMRDFMDQKRVRQRRCVQIENDSRPPRDRLIGEARLRFMRETSAKWHDELETRMNTARDAQGARLPKIMVDAIREKFWRDIDVRLDADKSGSK